MQNPTRIIHSLATPPVGPLTHKGSDLLYLTIGIIAGVLLILILILIVMCVLRFIQRKKLISMFHRKRKRQICEIVSLVDHIQSVNGSDYYCDGVHKSVNADYAATPCMQHAVVSVDGKLIPFAYPTNVKSPKLFWQGRATGNSTTTDNGTIRLNTNPMHRLDDENPMDKQENFYHTLTPFTCHTQYEDCQSQTCSRNPTGRHRSYQEG